MIPPAPPRVLTTTDFPMRSASWKAIMRPTTSLLPPGGKGITRRSGFVGEVWAWTVQLKSAAKRDKTILRVIVSLRLNSGGLDEPSVLSYPALQHRRKLLGRVGDHRHRQLVDLPAPRGVPGRADQLVVELRGRRGSQASGAEQAEPRGGLLEAGQRLGHR